MNDKTVTRLLQRAGMPDELDAERRTWAVVRAAYEEAAPRPERRWPTRPLLLLAAGLAIVAAAFSPPGAAVAAWIRAAITEDPRDAPRAALASLPTGGVVLVTSERGVWVVRANGSKRLLGRYDDAVWSPRGLHVAVTRGPRLVALTANGEVRWSITRSAPVRDPQWSPSGYRIAYRVGRTLHVVHGDASPDDVVARSIAAVPAAWRPTPDHVLAYTEATGRVHVVDTDTGRTLWRSARGCVHSLAWSADGRRLLASCPSADRLFDASGRLLDRRDRRAPVVHEAVAFAPTAHRVAYTERTSRGGTTRVVVGNADRPGRVRMVFETRADFGQLVWAPGGRWVLVTWPAADQWIFVRVSGPPKIVTVSNVSAEFDPGGSGAAPFPSVTGWCCAR